LQPICNWKKNSFVLEIKENYVVVIMLHFAAEKKEPFAYETTIPDLNFTPIYYRFAM
jgi:hypothetical protein